MRKLFLLRGKKLFVACLVVALPWLLTGCLVDNERATETSFRPGHFQNQPIPRSGYGYQPYQQPSPYYRGAPNSRMYYNPYEFQQPYGSNPYSDYDQYYVPPVQYYNNEYQKGIEDTFSGSPR